MKRCLVVFVGLLLCLIACTGCATSAHLPFFSSAAATPSPAKGVAWGYIDDMWRDGRGQYNWTGIRSDLRDMHRAGITWARVTVTPEHPMTFYDRIVQLARAYHVNLLALVLYGRDLGDMKQRAAYRSWLARLVHRYGRQVEYWEIHNEENLSDDWNIDTDARNQHAYSKSVHRYVLHLRDSYLTIRSINPAARVLLGGLSEWHVERYLDRLLAERAYRYLDIVAYHPYGDDPDAVIRRLDALKAKMRLQSGLARKPIWITEIGFYCAEGWSTAGYACPEKLKARYLVETMEMLRANGVQTPIFWYVLHEADATNGYGLVRKGDKAGQTAYLPAFYAYRDLWSARAKRTISSVSRLRPGSL